MRRRVIASSALSVSEFIAKYHSSTTLLNGNLADVCNQHIIPSPYQPIKDYSKFTPVPEFISARWKVRIELESVVCIILLVDIILTM